MLPLSYLEQLKSSPGIIYARFLFLSQFDSIDWPTSFRGLDVTGGKKGFDLASSDIDAITLGAITYNQKRFTVNDILKHFYIFDPTNWPTTGNDHELITAYDRQEMVQILSHSEVLFDSNFCQKVMDQWLRLKFFVCKRVPLDERQAHILWQRITTQDCRFSSVMKVVSTFMLLRMSTAVCERGFSMMNRIKSENRAVMVSSTLNTLMLLSIHGHSLESFNPQAAVNHWASTVHRRPGVRKPKTSTVINVDNDEDTYDFSDYSDDDIELHDSDSEETADELKSDLHS
jgi:hypothetical protein